LQLSRGDQLLMFTDGLVEACDQDDAPFGEASLVFKSGELVVRDGLVVSRPFGRAFAVRRSQTAATGRGGGKDYTSYPA
jgi:hypothetical protein